MLAEQGLDVNDVPLEGDELSKGGTPIETKNIEGLIGIHHGIGVIYKAGNIIKQQSFVWGRRGLTARGYLRDVSNQKYKIEERSGIDLDGDGKIGEDGFEDIEVKKILVKATDDSFWGSLCKLTSGTYVICDRIVKVGLPTLDPYPIKDADGQPFDAQYAVGMVSLRRGFGLITKQEDTFKLQKFKIARIAKAYGRQYDITKAIGAYEVDAQQDFNGDQLIGDVDTDVDIEIGRTVFPGDDKFDMGLYEIKDTNKSLIMAEMDLRPGETPFEDEAILDRSGQPYPGGKAVGMYPIKRGFALLEQQADGRLTQQGFREKRGVLRAFGKPRKAKRLCYYEEKIDFDFDNNQKVGCFDNNRGSRSRAVGREVEPIDMASLVDPLS